METLTRSNSFRQRTTNVSHRDQTSLRNASAGLSDKRSQYGHQQEMELIRASQRLEQSLNQARHEESETQLLRRKNREEFPSMQTQSDYMVSLSSVAPLSPSDQ